ncbi:uncharacterized protein OCT59_029961 [Rhizophagus irregularis]|uniref:uncharacterized protein n=1 Tax=Rhizophagus irregularis TaxID=588596 RepID=UPI00332F79A3|nr:hypothetical protein OCT59_029961 [Rhizophagus irregularis]
MNTKYRISKYLTSVFCGLPIDIETRNKYFLRIRQLLLDKLVVIKNRMKKQEKNRQTTTYIKFSHGRTWYLGFYIPCSFCSKFYAYVMSRNKKVCQNCRSKVIVTPTPPPQNVFKNFCQVKQVISKRVGVSYTKKVSMDGGAGAVSFKAWELKRRTDILKKHYISEKEMEFLKKEAFFERKDSKIAEQSSSAGQCTTIDNIITNLQEMEISGQNNVAPWQGNTREAKLQYKAEFHRELNSIRDKCLLTTYCNSVRRGRRVRDVTHDYVVNQCAIRARKIEQGMWY